MSLRSAVRTIVALMLCALPGALAQMPNPYGLSITLENAKKAAMPALAEATKNNWSMAVAVVDPAGNLVYYEKMDNTLLAPRIRQGCEPSSRLDACLTRD